MYVYICIRVYINIYIHTHIHKAPNSGIGASVCNGSWSSAFYSHSHCCSSNPRLCLFLAKVEALEEVLWTEIFFCYCENLMSEIIEWKNSENSVFLIPSFPNSFSKFVLPMWNQTKIMYILDWLWERQMCEETFNSEKNSHGYGAACKFPTANKSDGVQVPGILNGNRTNLKIFGSLK